MTQRDTHTADEGAVILADKHRIAGHEVPAAIWGWRAPPPAMVGLEAGREPGSDRLRGCLVRALFGEEPARPVIRPWRVDLRRIHLWDRAPVIVIILLLLLLRLLLL